MPFLNQILLAGSLSASAGLRAFMPLVITAWVVRTGVMDKAMFNKTLYPYLAENDVVFYALIGLLILEIVLDKIPSMASLIDIFNILFKPLCGALASLSVINMPDPVQTMVTGIILGLILTMAFQKYQANCRELNVAPHANMYNVFISLVEDVLSLTGSLISFYYYKFAFPVNLVVYFGALQAFNMWKIKLQQAQMEEDMDGEDDEDEEGDDGVF